MGWAEGSLSGARVLFIKEGHRKSSSTGRERENNQSALKSQLTGKTHRAEPDKREHDAKLFQITDIKFKPLLFSHLHFMK